MTEILPAMLFGPLLWLVGAIVFDGVHWLLHGMLRSHNPLLRALARPHGVHHEWIDRKLVTHWELETANVWCHIVPEYLTQIVFTGLVAWLLPLPYAIVLLVLQTAVFLGILNARGRDVNHRPTERIDAHPPGWRTPPTYHLLHHAWPDAYFSAYTKVVDWMVGGGAQLADRHFACSGPDSTLVAALRAELRRVGARVDVHGLGSSDADVLILTDPIASLVEAVEAFIEETRGRQLPPEVWAFRERTDDGVARHYFGDPRVAFRTLLVPESGSREPSPDEAKQAARSALFWIQRDVHVATLGRRAGWRVRRRFLHTRPLEPQGVERARHRMEFLSGSQPGGAQERRRSP